MEAAKRVSQRVAHSSTHRNAGGLIFRVRDGYGRNPAAVAAVTPTDGLEPSSNRSRWCVQDRHVRVVQFASGPVLASRIQCDNVVVMSVWLGRLVLADSTPRCLGAYIPSLSNSSSTSGLGGISFPGGFRA